MNKSLYLTHWLLVILLILSLLSAVHSGIALNNITYINDFIAQPDGRERVPEHVKAQFSVAYSEVQKEQPTEALDHLTSVLATHDSELETAAYFNRANIHLRAAQALASDDNARIALVGLAKQDYRSALLVNPNFWDARYNLELALLMVPEDPADSTKYTKRKDAQSVVVKAVGFRVDLP